jgi:hypothetical protein
MVGKTKQLNKNFRLPASRNTGRLGYPHVLFRPSSKGTAWGNREAFPAESTETGKRTALIGRLFPFFTFPAGANLELKKKAFTLLPNN